MKLLPAVLQAKEHLRQEGGVDFETICMLTELRESTYAGYYESMWSSIERHTLPEDKETFHWVLWFVHAVSEARCLPPYYYSSKQEREELIASLHSLTNKITSLYSLYELDAQLVYSYESVLEGFFIYEELAPIERDHVDSCRYNRCPARGCHHNRCLFDLCDSNPCPKGGGGNQKIAFTKILDMFAARSIKQINLISARGKAGKNVEITRFIRSLAEYNKAQYGDNKAPYEEKPLYEVIRTALLAVYNVERSVSTIWGLLNRSQPLQS